MKLLNSCCCFSTVSYVPISAAFRVPREPHRCMHGMVLCKLSTKKWITLWFVDNCGGCYLVTFHLLSPQGMWINQMPVQISTRLAKLWKLFFWKVSHDVYIEIAQVMGFPDFERFIRIHVVNGSHEILTCNQTLEFRPVFWNKHHHRWYCWWKKSCTT